MAGRLTGKRAVVTAAGQGIGRAIAAAFLAEGAEVLATDLDAGKLEGLRGAQAASLDVRSDAAVAEFAKGAGPVDVLVNAAGFVHHGTILDCTDAEWELAFDLNVRSMHRTIRAFLPGMLERGNGSIVNIASAVGADATAPNRYVYGASKAAVVGLTKAVARDYIRSGVRANAICPGTIQSPSLDERIAALASMNKTSVEEARQAFIDRQPMGRLGTTEEMGALAVYLASDESRFTTGQCHVADGGFTL